MLTFNRKIHQADNRVQEGNFALDGLLGFCLHVRTVGIVDTGQIGALVARITAGFGCRLLGFDLHPEPHCEAMRMEYVSVDGIPARSDAVEQ